MGTMELAFNLCQIWLGSETKMSPTLLDFGTSIDAVEIVTIFFPSCIVPHLCTTLVALNQGLSKGSYHMHPQPQVQRKTSKI